jgi:hypothetical protein
LVIIGAIAKDEIDGMTTVEGLAGCPGDGRGRVDEIAGKGLPASGREVTVRG